MAAGAQGAPTLAVTGPQLEGDRVPVRCNTQALKRLGRTIEVPFADGVIRVAGARAASAERPSSLSVARELSLEPLLFLAHSPDQIDQVRNARRSIKILDTYFGNFDQFQASLSHVLSERQECRVQILLAPVHQSGNVAFPCKNGR